MINASREFKEKLKNGSNIVNYADVTLSDGEVLHLEPKDFMIGGCRIDDKATDGKFGVGYAVGKTLSIKIANHKEQYSQYDFFNSIIILYVAMLMDDGTIEKIRKGKYYATVPQTPGDIIEISAVDDMYKLDRPYNAATSYPATLQTILSDCCLDCGIPMKFRQFDNYNFVVDQRPEGLTYRQVVSYVCQVAGYNARIDNDGYMDLIWYNSDVIDGQILNGGDYKYKDQPIINGGNFTDYSTDLIISGGLFTDAAPENIYQIKTLSVHTDDVVITGVRVVFEDTESLFGEEGYVIQLKDNPFTQGKEREVADYLGARMVGMVFRPFTAQVLNNPLYEPFEVVRVYDRKGNIYLSIINSVSYTIGSYTSISCEAEDPVRNGSQYFSAAAQAVVEARRNTDKKLSEYDKAVQNMNQIAMNAMGFHTTYEEQEDGSRVTYLHDKPNLSDSKIIYKQTIDGFFLSQDGGKSYTAGFDSQGNAVVNILYAIGIVCDWIKGGTLTLGGSNNVNGLINILSAAGEQIGRWGKDGISILKGIIKGTLIEVGGLDNSYGLVNVYDNSNKLCNQLSYNGMILYNNGTYTGNVGTSHMESHPEMKTIRFALAHGHAFMCWGYQEEPNGLSIIKFAYYSPAQSIKAAGLHMGAPLITNYYRIYIGNKYTSQYITGYNSGIMFYASSDINFYIGSSNKMLVSDSGLQMYSNINMHSYSILNESDERLKENIEESQEPALEIINNIQTYSFDWIETGKHENIDFIAQQLNTVTPELVEIDEETDVYSINKAGLIPYLVKALQELTEQVKELREEVAELKGEKVISHKKIKKEWTPDPYTKEEKRNFVEKLTKLREVKEAEPIPIVED